jgi:hypothetical protein
MCSSCNVNCYFSILWFFRLYSIPSLKYSCWLLKAKFFFFHWKKKDATNNTSMLIFAILKPDYSCYPNKKNLFGTKYHDQNLESTMLLLESSYRYWISKQGTLWKRKSQQYLQSELSSLYIFLLLSGTIRQFRPKCQWKHAMALFCKTLRNDITAVNT